MRTRQEIWDDANGDHRDSDHPMLEDLQDLKLEVLLDIRDFVSKIRDIADQIKGKI